jgi:hypothetical protein
MKLNSATKITAFAISDNLFTVLFYLDSLPPLSGPNAPLGRSPAIAPQDHESVCPINISSAEAPPTAE